MMNKAIFVTGTDTGVGKTFVASGIANSLRELGCKVVVMKPVATGARRCGRQLISADVKALNAVCPYVFRHPLAPVAAAGLEKRNISKKKILSCFEKLHRDNNFIVVEGIGGLLVPLKRGYLVSDLILDMDIPAVVVARPGLGTINHTLLTVKYAENFGIKVAGIIFNEAEKIKNGICQRTNPEIIKAESGMEILGRIKHGGSAVNRKEFRHIAGFLLQNTKDKRRPAKYERIDKRCIWHPFTQMGDWQREKPLIIEEAKGCYLKSLEDKWYLDGVSSLWVNVHGHRKKQLDQALIRQIGRVSHSTLLGLGNTPSIELAEMLVDIAPKGLKKVFYSDNGSTAVEAGLKIAFQYWQEKGLKRKTKFLSFTNAYHGDTIGSVSVGGIDLFHRKYKPFLFKAVRADYPYCYRCGFAQKYPDCNLACLKRLENILSKQAETIAAVVIEPLVEGAAGMLVSPPGFLKAVGQLCKKYNCLMVADEVATGFGRTGRMFACEHEEVCPDIMAVAKSITGGYLPLAATLTTDEIYSAFCGDYAKNKTFFHGHTYTGNPLACAVAIENLKLYKKENILRKLRAKISFLKKGLVPFRNLGAVGDIRQKGFMVGIELVRDKKTKKPYKRREKIGIKVIMKARQRGVILRPLGDIIVLMPPLAISIKDLKRLLDGAYWAIRQVTEYNYNNYNRL